MKNLLLSSLLLLLVSMSCSSQNRTFNTVFDRYADRDGFVTVKLSNPPPGLLSDGDNDSDFTISSLRILTVKDDALNAKINFYREIVPQLNRSGYEELLSVSNKNDKSILLCKKHNKVVTDVLFVSGGTNNVMIELNGKMSLAQAEKITSKLSNNNDDDESGDK
ncbi:MAG: DUF4252 domain-containing protein [Bacteroidetes bacterium]|nr:DUF4252 domain-containing protein [Bacteroidota bacterium]